uniref:Uncharacterized protein n=1 Tax=mine drainage metagenome TaxID=410659 RepID=E6Q5Q5_9ZZZZ
MILLLFAVIREPGRSMIQAVSVDWAQAASAHATIALAICTGLLVFATAVAVFFGARAATLAANTYRLESEPIITIRLIEGPNEGLLLNRIVPTDYIVRGKPALADGIEIGALTANETRQSVGGSGMPRPSILLEVQNLGRSPALDLRIPFRATVANSSKERILTSTSGERDEAAFVAVNEITLLGVASQSAAYLRVFHNFGISATIMPQDEATIRTQKGAKMLRQSITVISGGPFVIMDPTTYEYMKKRETDAT